ncbi:hypothetical protein BpHYR1_040001 [Brachionus plicatilis]|uniref:Uncharacterized protein n=1 Tax=Brachionus plicatilis TaxID=10195 RepID=A0A3M7RFW3_BRAPC|nr:hypothetical protein BpHYR1_040001 [Brachionus plicatilis]
MRSIFIKKPTYVYIQSINNNIYVEDLPNIITIENCKYRFLYSTVQKPGHFLGIFEINNNLYSVDDTTRNIQNEINFYSQFKFRVKILLNVQKNASKKDVSINRQKKLHSKYVSNY